MGGFGYDGPIIERFPSIRAGVIHATGLDNGPTPEPLLDAYLAEQELVGSQIADIPLSETPSIAAWRRVFTSFGVKPTQYRNAAESLLRRLVKKGDIPSINTLVDLVNLISIRHRMPVAVFDQRAVTGSTTVRFAVGDERFTDLGSDIVSHPEEDEVIFVDDDSLVSARRWCWRQSDQSAAGPGTVEVLITIEGHHDGADTDVEQATDDLLGLLRAHQPAATTSHAVLTPGSPRFEP